MEKDKGFVSEPMSAALLYKHSPLLAAAVNSFLLLSTFFSAASEAY